MIACIGHWYTSMLYVAPVAIIGGIIGVQSMRDRRREAAEGDTPDTPAVSTALASPPHA